MSSGNTPSELLKNMAKTGWNSLSKRTPNDYLMAPYEQRPASSMLEDYPRPYNGEYGPTPPVLCALV